MLQTALAHRAVEPLLSDAPFSVNGTRVKVWASMKSFQPKQEGAPPDDDVPGNSSAPRPDQTPDQTPDQPIQKTALMTRPAHRNRNTEVDVRGEKRSNANHASVTDPDARLFKTSPDAGATLCFMGHTVLETRNGLIVQADLTQTCGHAERRAALDTIHRHSPGSTRRLTLGADKGYDRADFGASCDSPASPCMAAYSFGVCQPMLEWTRPVFVRQAVRRFHVASLISDALLSRSGFSQTGLAGLGSWSFRALTGC